MKRRVRPLAVRDTLQPKQSPLSGTVGILLIVVVCIFVTLAIGASIR